MKWFGQDSTSGKVEKQERGRDPFGRASAQGWVCVCCTIWSRSWSGGGAGALQAAVKQLRLNL